MTHVVDSIELGGIVTVRDKLLQMQSEGRKIYRLESGDPSFDITPYVAEAINKAIKDGHTHYTAGAGIKPLREAIANKLVDNNHISASPNNVLVTNGAMHALYIAFRALCEPGDEVIMPDPTWTETADNVTLAGGVPVRVSTKENKYRYTADLIKEKITPKTVAIVINSPHNPTGVVITQKEIEDIISLAGSKHLWIISDEAYEDIIYDNKQHISPASYFGCDDIISIYSFSKSHAMSGLRLGYLYCKDFKMLERMAKLLRCTINGVNSATQYGGVAALTSPQNHIVPMLANYALRRSILMDGLSGSILEPVSPEGAFYIWADIKDTCPLDGWDLCNLLIEKMGIGGAPGIVFGPSNKRSIRFAFSCPTQQVFDASAILKLELQYINKYTR